MDRWQLPELGDKQQWRDLKVKCWRDEAVSLLSCVSSTVGVEETSPPPHSPARKQRVHTHMLLDGGAAAAARTGQGRDVFVLFWVGFTMKTFNIRYIIREWKTTPQQSVVRRIKH